MTNRRTPPLSQAMRVWRWRVSRSAGAVGSAVGLRSPTREEAALEAFPPREPSTFCAALSASPLRSAVVLVSSAAADAVAPTPAARVAADVPPVLLAASALPLEAPAAPVGVFAVVVFATPARSATGVPAVVAPGAVP